MSYKVKVVNPETREYETKFGEMVSYQVLFEGMTQPVEISRKKTSPAPNEGDELEGTIDMSAPYGPKFKQSYTPRGGGGGSYSGGGSSSSGASSTKFENSQFTMYLSYAKDLAVAMMEKGEVDEAKFGKVLEMVLAGGSTLYDGRPGATTETTDTPTTATSSESVANVFGGGEVDVTGDIPWVPKK